ncbi:MAG TPA: sulfite oxidase [Solirubrobacteraceae bacterium]|nr:sulfite oxidase [Solirubrobacteraceae bacterium]
MRGSRFPATGTTGGDGARAPAGEGSTDRRLTRRAALSLGGALAGAATAATAAPALAGHQPRQPTPDRPPPSADLISYEEAVLAFRCHGFHEEMLDRPITPLGSHYVLIHFDIPALSADDYAITVGGRVNTPLTLSLADLKSRPAIKQPTILECAGVGRSLAHPRSIYVPWFREPMGVYEYTGTPLRPILEEAGLLDDATDVVFTGFDSGIDLGVKHAFERALPVDEALKDGVMLAWDANDQPLLPEHGFPLRLIVPTWYGMASVKWLKKITVIDHTYQGVEQKQVYRLQPSSSDGGRAVREKAVRAAMKPPGFPDAISRMRFVSPGRVELRGMAWSGSGPITAVEVSADDRSTWQPATLEEPVSPYAWTPWRFTWDANATGEFILSCRATDAAGNRQPLKPFWTVQGMAQNGVERIPVRVN